jgi:hypothetical protein
MVSFSEHIVESLGYEQAANILNWNMLFKQDYSSWSSKILRVISYTNEPLAVLRYAKWNADTKTQFK